MGVNGSPARCERLAVSIEREKRVLFEQLVYHTVHEEVISIQRGSELIKLSFNDVLAMCHFIEV